MEDSLNEKVIIIGATIISAIASFLFGASGLFSDIKNYFFKKKERESMANEKLLISKDEEIKELKLQIDDIIKTKSEAIQELSSQTEALKKTIAILDKDLVKMTTYIKILLPYLETLMPEGSNPFIKEMAKEIRENTPR